MRKTKKSKFFAEWITSIILGDFSVRLSPFGLDFGLWTSDLGLTIFLAPSGAQGMLILFIHASVHSVQTLV